MIVVNMLDAKTHLSRLVDAVERGQESEIVIARNGKPAARLVAVSEANASRRLGLLAGRYPAMSLDDFNADAAELAELFNGKDG